MAKFGKMYSTGEYGRLLDETSAAISNQPSAMVKQVPVQHDNPSISLIVGRGLVRSEDEGQGGKAGRADRAAWAAAGK
ncbi:hypothetical protein V496_00307 [Pseudogymnoascus sp. VKM F-4515 (FW-2607)]|nr:hypothetical protein V496_00307 [Pseudogymnoascus sp. VKM F-4515 (FW-2607)]